MPLINTAVTFKSLATVTLNVNTSTVHHERHSGVKKTILITILTTLLINEKALGNEQLKILNVVTLNSCFQVTK